jgi:hypothetical protein
MLSNVSVRESMLMEMSRVTCESVCKAIRECGRHYSFDAEEALRVLGVMNMSCEIKKKEKKEKCVVLKASFPLPFNGEYDEKKCHALRQNNGLYTQCQIAVKDGKSYCKSCEGQVEKNGHPDYGTIEERLACDVFEYRDPKGKKPVAYTKIMKKYKLSEEQVLAEAEKMNIKINPKHFEEIAEEPKKGRPKAEKEPKEKVEKAKGRPKKSKKVIEIEGEDEDLFASLIASANNEPEADTEADTEAKKAQEKAEKEAKKALEKAEKEAKKALEKAEKEAKLAAEKAEKEAKKAAEKAEKEAKKAEKEAKKEPKTAKKKAVVEEEQQEQEVVKKIEFEGKKYLKSKNSGIIYDYNEYTTNGEQVVVGKWNDATNKIDFKEDEDDEEEEEEYYN